MTFNRLQATGAHRSAILTRTAFQCIVGIVPLLFVPGLDAPDLPPRLLLLQLLTAVMVIGWLGQGGRMAASPFYLSIGLYVVLMAASTFWSVVPFRAVHSLVKQAAVFCLFMALHQALDRRHIPHILRIGALTGAVVSLLGILEYHGIMPHWIPSTGRPSSTFMFRNLAAHYLITNMPLAGLLFLTASKDGDRWLGSISATLMFVFLLYTRTRGAWFGLFVATVLNLLVWVLCGRHTLFRALKSTFDRHALKFAIGALLFVALLGPLKAAFHEQHIQRFDEKKADIASAVTSIFEKGGDRGRVKMWRHTLAMIADHPALGVGLGNWEVVYPRYDRGDQVSPNATPKRPHNDPIWIWAEIGTLGLLAYLSILVIFLIRAIRVWKDPAISPGRHLTVLMCGTTIFAMTGDGFFNFPWERVTPVVHFWFALALASRCFTAGTSDLSVDKSGRVLAYLMLFILAGGIWITSRHIAFDYHYIRALQAHFREDHTRVISETASAMAMGPFNFQILILNAQHLKAQSRYAEAESSLRQSLRYHPYFPNTYNNLGHLYFEWGQPQKANRFYRRALEMLPTHYKAHYNMGIAYEKLGQPDSAIAAYKRAIARQAGFGKAHHNLANVYKQQGQIDSALAYYDSALKATYPTPESYYNLGNLFQEQHQFARAIEAYDAFIEHWQGDPLWLKEAQKALSEAHSGQGVALEMQGDLDGAISHYKVAIDHWPQNAMSWYNLGNAYRQQGKYEQAISSYLTAIERDSTLTNAHGNLGLIYTDQRKFSRAIEIFQKALQIHPEHAVIYLNLGNAYMGKGDVVRAAEAYEQCLKFWDGAPEAVDGVRRILKELKAQLAS